MGQAAQPKRLSGKVCSKLCGFVELSSKATSPAITTFAYSKGTVMQLFDFYTQWNETEQHRSMQLVLDLVPRLILGNPSTETADQVRATILHHLMTIVAGKSTKPQVKSAIKSLGYFLNKSLFSLGEIAASYASTKQLASHDDPSIWDLFVTELFDWMRFDYLCPMAGKLIVDIYLILRGQENSTKPAYQVTVSSWNHWLLSAVDSNPALLEPIKHYVFMPLFKADRNASLEFLHQINHVNAAGEASRRIDGSAALHLAALDVEKKSGLVEEPGLQTNGTCSGEVILIVEIGQSDELSAKSDIIVLDEQLLDTFLSHPLQDVRSSALSLIVASPSPSRPYSAISLKLLKKHLPSFFPDFDAKFRMEVMSMVKAMYKRARGAILMLERSLQRHETLAKKAALKSQSLSSEIGKTTTDSQADVPPTNYLSEPLSDHEQFLTWFFAFLRNDLIPTASYQRHVAALKATAQILRLEADEAKPWGTSRDKTLLYSVFDQTWVRLLLDLMLDPFDEVRECSSQVLRHIFLDKRFTRLLGPGIHTSKKIHHVLPEFINMANEEARRSGRADKADGSARSWELLYRFSPEPDRLSVLVKLVASLQYKLFMAESDLGGAVLNAPIHADFASLW